uniref:Uncharacterized protein n=1 Tax=Aplanochytrium stocchinoi TaxID=215587 RepID=A0A7S3PRM0_9STRA|mmetsp:Transcript_35620/g.44135  ORF Transcript_35620/g.44135 Transcript_35620/m.44135 type:complete len:589 (+) Transcript_35620:215-1981(+)
MRAQSRHVLMGTSTGIGTTSQTQMQVVEAEEAMKHRREHGPETSDSNLNLDSASGMETETETEMEKETSNIEMPTSVENQNQEYLSQDQNTSQSFYHNHPAYVNSGPRAPVNHLQVPMPPSTAASMPPISYGFTNNYPRPVSDPAQSFLWGAQNLFAGLSTVNTKLEALELRTRSLDDQRRRLDSLRNFVQSIYRQLQSHNDYVRGKQFLVGVRETASDVVVTKCLPEIWKLRANVEGLAERLPIKENNILHIREQRQGNGPVNENRTVPSDTCASLAREVELLVLRLAALGDERVQHVEIVGNGKRYKDGSSIRRMVTEDQLGKGNLSHLGIPKSWRSQSDTKTINSNFKEVGKMFNDVILPRIDTLEKHVEKRLDRLEKRVDILHGLFRTLNSNDSNKTTPEVEGNKKKSTASESESRSNTVPEESKQETSKKTMVINTKTNEHVIEGALVSGMNTNVDSSSDTSSNNIDVVASSSSSSSQGLALKHSVQDKPNVNMLAKRQTINTNEDPCAKVESGSSSDGTGTDHANPTSFKSSPGMNTKEQPRKTHHQLGAAAGRAAFNRSKEGKGKENATTKSAVNQDQEKI